MDANTTDYLLIEVPHQRNAEVTYMTGAEIIDHAYRLFEERDNWLYDSALPNEDWHLVGLGKNEEAMLVEIREALDLPADADRAATLCAARDIDIDADEHLTDLHDRLFWTARFDTVDAAVEFIGDDLSWARAVPVEEAAEYLRKLDTTGDSNACRVQSLGERLLLAHGIAATPEQIKEIREQFGWNTSALGEELGVSGRTVENWEQGRRGVPRLACKALAALAAD